MKKKQVYVIGAVLVVMILIGGVVVSKDTNQVVEAQVLEGVEMTFYRSPSCGCCAGHAAALEAAGATVDMQNVDEVTLQTIKEEHGIALNKQSCHTAIIDDYVVEGHVPIEALAQFLTERPETRGITLPGMPIGTPGMPGLQVEPYIVETLEGEVYWRKDPVLNSN
jgi:hypothetical protein